MLFFNALPIWNDARSKKGETKTVHKKIQLNNKQNKKKQSP